MAHLKDQLYYLLDYCKAYTVTYLRKALRCVLWWAGLSQNARADWQLFTHTQLFALSHTHKQTFSLSLTHTHLSLSHTHTHTHTRSLSHTHTFISLTQTHTRSLSHTHTHTRCLSLSLRSGE